jgi:hypothetical protein
MKMCLFAVENGCDLLHDLQILTTALTAIGLKLIYFSPGEKGQELRKNSWLIQFTKIDEQVW